MFSVASSFVGAQAVRWIEENCRLEADEDAIGVCMELWRGRFFRHTFERFKFSSTCFFFWRDEPEVSQLIANAERARQAEVPATEGGVGLALSD